MWHLMSILRTLETRVCNVNDIWRSGNMATFEFLKKNETIFYDNYFLKSWNNNEDGLPHEVEKFKKLFSNWIFVF